MKLSSPSDLTKIRAQVARTLEVLDELGPEALRRARDWATPLSSSQGPGPKNGVSDPTGNAATTDDVLRDQWAFLSVELGQLHDSAVAVVSRVCRVGRDAVVQNERAGIGWCRCGRYCDGTKSNRLRSGECPACAAKTYRGKPEAKACAHPSTHWSQGVTTCLDCGVQVA